MTYKEREETGAPSELSGKVHDWLAQEGYPLEYYVANCFSGFKFRVHQGAYVRVSDEAPREVDVLAAMEIRHPEYRRLTRAYTVVECKWTKSKPWVAFTARTGRMMESAVIAQSISSELGESAAWLNAGEARLQKLQLFSSPEMPAFGGRQALGGGSDVFYNALRSVAGAASALAKKYDRYRAPDEFPHMAVVAFPLIVIDGSLFSASYNPSSDKLLLEEVQQVRFHWRGDPSSPLLTTIDVVTRDGLPAFAELRAKDTQQLLAVLDQTSEQLDKCWTSKSLKHLERKGGSTGIIGSPRLLYSIHKRSQETGAEPKKEA